MKIRLIISVLVGFALLGQISTRAEIPLPLKLAMQLDDWDSFQAFSKQSKLENNPHIQGEEGDTLLHYSVAAKSLKITSYLLKMGCNPNAQFGKMNITPLHLAVNLHSIELIGILVEYHAYVDPVDYLDRTPLFYAVIAGDTKIISTLLNYGANVNHYSELDGTTPLDVAMGFANTNLVAYLTQNGAKAGPDTIKQRLEKAIVNGPMVADAAKSMVCFNQSQLNVISIQVNSNNISVYPGEIDIPLSSISRKDDQDVFGDFCARLKSSTQQTAVVMFYSDEYDQPAKIFKNAVEERVPGVVILKGR